MKILRRPAAPAPHIDGRENAPVHRHQMRREGDDHLAAGGQRKLLVEFGHVAVMADAIGVEALRHFREQHRLLRRPPAPVMPDLASIDDLVGLDRLGLEQRDQRQLRAGGVAARIGDQPRLLDLAPIDLDEAVDRLLLQLGRVMLVAVPLRVGRRIGEPEVGRQIDHLGRRRLCQKILHHLLRGRMRQRAERPDRDWRRAQSTPSMRQAAAARTARTAETRRRIAWPARRSAVSSTISTRGWRSSSRTSSAPV